MNDAGSLPRRCGRYGAGILFIAGIGVVSLVGVLAGTPLRGLWIPLFWGGVASVLLGWAVGHAAGRLYAEAVRKAGDRPVAVEENDSLREGEKKK